MKYRRRLTWRSVNGLQRQRNGLTGEHGQGHYDRVPEDCRFRHDDVIRDSGRRRMRKIAHKPIISIIKFRIRFRIGFRSRRSPFNLGIKLYFAILFSLKHSHGLMCRPRFRWNLQTVVSPPTEPLLPRPPLLRRETCKPATGVFDRRRHHHHHHRRRRYFVFNADIMYVYYCRCLLYILLLQKRIDVSFQKFPRFDRGR